MKNLKLLFPLLGTSAFVVAPALTVQTQKATNKKNNLGDGTRKFPDSIYQKGAHFLVSSDGDKVNFWETITIMGMQAALPWVANQGGNNGHNIADWLYKYSGDGFKDFIIDVQEGYWHIQSDDTFFYDLKSDHSDQANSYITNRINNLSIKEMKVNVYYHYNSLFKDYITFTLYG